MKNEKLKIEGIENRLSISDLSVGYGSNPIVHNASFDVNKGEVCALLGLNGSGKTTLLKGICGLLPVSNGTVRLGETDLTTLSEKKRAQYITLIPQRHSKLIGVTVLDAVLMGLNAKLGIFDAATYENEKQAMQALTTMQIPHLAMEDFSKLSEGQKQLVILSRMLLQDTPVTLLDEPDSSLDFLNRHMMLSRVRDLSHAGNKACIITLHDPHLAVNYCDKLVLLDKGRVTGSLSTDGAGQDDINEFLSVIYGDTLRRLSLQKSADI